MSDDKSNQTNHTSPKEYSAHKAFSGNPPTYEPVMPQNSLQRTFGYLLLIAVAIMSPLMAMIEVFWRGVTSLLGWGN